jgi:hypothetical protein
MALRISIPMPPRLTHYVLSAALESSYGATWLSEYSGNRSQWAGPDYVTLHIGEPIDNAARPKHSRIGAARIAVALELMLTSGGGKHGERAGRVLCNDFDAPDADVVLQFAAFGEVIYG